MNTERAALLAAALIALALAVMATGPVEPPTVEVEAPAVELDAPAGPPARVATDEAPLGAVGVALPSPVAARRPVTPTARRLRVEALATDRGARPVIAGELVFVFGAVPREVAAARLADAGLVLLDYTPTIGAARAGLPAGWSVAEGLAHARGTGLPEAAPNALAWGADRGPLHALDLAALDAAASRAPDGATGRSAAGDADGAIDPWAPPTRSEIASADSASMYENSYFVRTLKALNDYYNRDYPVVAVVDSGVLYKSAVLPWGAFVRRAPYDTVTTVGGYDFVRDHALGLDENQHGTHVASTVARTASYRAQIMPVKVLDRLSMGTEYDVARGMLHAIDGGADIINLSLTFGLYYVPSPLFAEVLDRCQHGDVLVVAAAGNDSAETVTYPAALRGVVAVGADRPDLAGFANHGAALDLVAPAGASPADQSGVASESFRLYRPAQPATVRLVGTSMAAAAVSGQIARIIYDLERDRLLPDGQPGTRVDFLRHVVVHSAAPLGDAAFDPSWGMGVVDRDGAIALAGRLIRDGLVASTAGERVGVAAQTSVFIEETTVEGAAAVRGVALVEAIDHAGRPLAGATLYGDWLGGARGPARCTTDGWGRCVVEAPAIALPAGARPGALVGLTVHRALTAGDAAHEVRPAERYHAPRAAQLGHTSPVLEFVTAADALDADELALLDVLDPVTGAPLYCLGDTCPGYAPELGDPDDLYRIGHRRIYLATRYPGGAPPAESLLAGPALAPSYQYRRHGRALQGGGLVLAFDDHFAQGAALALGDDLVLVPDGLRLGSLGPGEPLLWVNDLTEAVIVEGTGMMTSGVSVIGYSLPLWSAQQFYVVNVGGAGMMTSGVSITFTRDVDYFNYNLALIGQSFATFGSALLDATHPPFALLALDHLEP